MAALVAVVAGALLATSGSGRLTAPVARERVGTHARRVMRRSRSSPPVAAIWLDARRPVLPVPNSFLGLSTEYWTLPLYEREPTLFERAISLVTVRGDGPPVLRIGGDSADRAVWRPSRRPAPGWAFALTPQWLRATSSVVRAMHLRLILDLNLLTTTPRRAAAWAHAAETALPRRSIVGFAIGNEDDIYDRAHWLAIGIGRRVRLPVLPSFFSVARYIGDFESYARVLARVAPDVPLIGPEVAEPARDLDWIAALLQAARPRLGLISAHRYPYSACLPHGSHAYPTIARLLGQHASVGVAHGVRGAVRLAHRVGLPFRLTELNSVTCGGLRGVSDTFATALWAPDTIFELLRAGVDGLNVHTRAYTVNAPFTLTPRGLLARPLLYGLALAARALGPHGELVQLRARIPHGLDVKAWCVRLRGGRTKVLLIDKGSRSVDILLHLRGRGPAEVERLLAPSVRSRSGVTLAGQQIGPDGRWWGALRVQPIERSRDGYLVGLPAYSAALVTVPLG